MCLEIEYTYPPKQRKGKGRCVCVYKDYGKIGENNVLNFLGQRILGMRRGNNDYV